MLLDRLFENLALDVEAFATCGVSRGWRLSVPELDFVTLHFVMQGEGALRDAAGLHPLPLYSLAVVPPQSRHSLECGQEVRGEAKVGDGPASTTPVPLHLAGSADDIDLIAACGRIQATYGAGMDLFAQLRETLIVEFTDSPTMRSTFEAILEEQRAARPAGAAMMSALMSQCLVLLFRRLSAHPECKLPWLSALDDPRLSRVLGEILERPEQPYSLEGLAALAGMSRSVFAKRFHQSFDRTPMDYVREVRLRCGARLLLRQELSVDAVAGRVGFASRSHFSRAFQEHFGCSPTVFRAHRG
jgi:AraC family transcriptional activator of mtrCDE